MQDLRDAFKHTQAVVNKTPSENPYLPSLLNNHGKTEPTE